MKETEIKGKELLIKRPPVAIYGIFTDLGRFVGNIPEEYKDQVIATADSITFSYNGIDFGIVVDERIPCSLISMKDDGKSPFKFNIRFIMTSVGLDSTLFHIELTAEMNVLLKMAIGNKLQEMVDMMTDQIESVMNGEMPDMENFKKHYFS